jgi:hypothetical protein
MWPTQPRSSSPRKRDRLRAQILAEAQHETKGVPCSSASGLGRACYDKRENLFPAHRAHCPPDRPQVSWPGLVARSTAAVRASRWLNRRGSPVVTVLVTKVGEDGLDMHDPVIG